VVPPSRLTPLAAAAVALVLAVKETQSGSFCPIWRTMSLRVGKRLLRARPHGSIPSSPHRGPVCSALTRPSRRRRLLTVVSSGSSSVSQRDEMPAFSSQFDGTVMSPPTSIPLWPFSSGTSCACQEHLESLPDTIIISDWSLGGDAWTVRSIPSRTHR
jgi:hypothetical protein